MRRQISQRMCVFLKSSVQSLHLLYVTIKLDVLSKIRFTPVQYHFCLFACKVMQKWRERFRKLWRCALSALGERRGELLLCAFVAEACSSLFLWHSGYNSECSGCRLTCCNRLLSGNCDASLTPFPSVRPPFLNMWHHLLSTFGI